MIGAGLLLYDCLAGKTSLPGGKRLDVAEIVRRATTLLREGLLGGYKFSDAQMDDHALGHWVAKQAQEQGVQIYECTEIASVEESGRIATTKGESYLHDRVINVAKPWAHRLLTDSKVETPFQLDLVRGSHLILGSRCENACMLEVPSDRWVFFILPWHGKALIGTTEVRLALDEGISCSAQERAYLLNAWQHYFPGTSADVVDTFAGLRPLLRSTKDPTWATREYAIHRSGKLVTVMSGKWTTALALVDKVTQSIK
jgi:glycerol-3-phosphate dehydrogenase